MRCTTSPVVVSITYTSASYRPLSHRYRPLADTPPMSGEPPGIDHVAVTCSVAKSNSDTLPPSRLVTYIVFESRLTYRPCAPRPVGTKPVTRNDAPSRT